METELDWMYTYSGGKFYFNDLSKSDISINDIAHALSLTCRFNGQCREFYSIAEHSIRVSRKLSGIAKLHGLMHDAAEAYTGDIVRGLKNQLFVELAAYTMTFSHWEETVLGVIYDKLNLPWPTKAEEEAVKIADNVLLATEARDLFDTLPDWDIKDIVPLPHTIRPNATGPTEFEFMLQYDELIGAYLDC